MASEIGRLRQLAAIKSGRADRYGFEGLGWSEHIEGACGELAVAKALKVYWDGSINTFSAPDLEGGVQVRTRSRADYELIIREADNSDQIYVLVTGRCPAYAVVGWILGAHGKREEWARSHGGRQSAFFVPHSALNDMTSFHRRAYAN